MFVIHKTHMVSLFLKLHKKHIFCKIPKLFCLVYLQHHKDQLEVVIWVKDFKKGLCQKINILGFFTKEVPLNSQAFEFVIKIIF